jgi:hypothetical protein
LELFSLFCNFSLFFLVLTCERYQTGRIGGVGINVGHNNSGQNAGISEVFMAFFLSLLPSWSASGVEVPRPDPMPAMEQNELPVN